MRFKLPTRRSSQDFRPLTAFSLEPRILFDGAAVASAAEATAPESQPPTVDDGALLDQQTDQVISALIDINPGPQSVESDGAIGLNLFLGAVPSSSVLNEATQQATQAILAFARQADTNQWFQLFNGDQQAPDADWNTRLEELLTDINGGRFKLSIVEMDGVSHFNAIAAYTREGPNGEPAIFINRYWFDTFDAPDSTRTLVEEFGHAIDDYLNPAGDTVGDEGEAFANTVTGAAGSEVFAANDDTGRVWVNGVGYDVERAGPKKLNSRLSEKPCYF